MIQIELYTNVYCLAKATCVVLLMPMTISSLNSSRAGQNLKS